MSSSNARLESYNMLLLRLFSLIILRKFSVSSNFIMFFEILYLKNDARAAHVALHIIKFYITCLTTSFAQWLALGGS